MDIKPPSRYDKYSPPKFHKPKPTNSEFITPEKIAETEIKSAEKQTEAKPMSTEPKYINIESVDETIDMNDNQKQLPKNQKNEKNWFSRMSKKKKILLITVLALLILLSVGLYFFVFNHKTVTKKPSSNSSNTTKIITKPVSDLVPSNLTGLMVNPSVNNLPVTGVMIENSLFARPQSGLGSAGVVFEALAEGGISRFLALYQDTQPSSVGPIRSARPYYVTWDLGFDAAYSHVGGSPEALADITNWNVKDLNQFYNGNYYQRISSRAAPHNVYTAISTLNQLEASDGFGKSNFTSWPRKSDSPLKVPTAKTINITLSSSDYNVSYAYNPATNEYLRSEGGSPHIDANTNTQISPKVVIAIVVPYSLESDGYHLAYQTIGSGVAYIFQDGGVTIGQWSKSSNTSQILFSDNSGSSIKLNSGQTWITAIGDTGSISYSP